MAVTTSFAERTVLVSWQVWRTRLVRHVMRRMGFCGELAGEYADSLYWSYHDGLGPVAAVDEDVASFAGTGRPAGTPVLMTTED